MNITYIELTNATADVLTASFTSSFTDFLQPLLFIITGLLILVAGQYIRNWAVIISSGVWFLGIAFSSVLGITTLGFSFTLYFALFGLLLIMHGVSNFAEQKPPRTVRMDD
jgi:predicted membrane protein